MKKVIFSLLITSSTLLMVSCGGKDKKDGGEEDDIDLTMANESPFQLAGYIPADTAKHFGKTITPEGGINIQNLAANETTANGYTGKVTGKVTSVCQNKGCWMTMDAGNGKTVMVTFKDYAFFVPKDLASGTVVTMEGKAELRTVSVDEQRHLAGDAGKSQAEIDAITQPKQELRFVADGVVIK